MKDLQKQEALERLDLLNLMDDVKEGFKEGQIYYSERQNKIFNAVLYFVTDDMKEKMKEFEERYNALVYHCQLLHTADGDMLTLFYVSQHQEEWIRDKEDIKKDEALVYTICYGEGEIGYIGIKPSMGGITRVW